MKIGIITGASKGIGLSIVKSLVDQDYKIYGFARSFPPNIFSHKNFIKISCDITNTSKLLEEIDNIKKNEHSIDLLINNAGVGEFGPHEQLNVIKLQNMIRTNFEAPIILSQSLLRNLKASKGTIITISSVTGKKVSTHGCAYGATKAGISHFYTSLFEEIRKTGVKVTTIHPDMTKTSFYDNLDFTTNSDENTYIKDSQVSDAVLYVINADSNMVVSDITIRPQLNKISRK
jgi:short-subunit dehydrogenase